jgi:hypothetical protein
MVSMLSTLVGKIAIEDHPARKDVCGIVVPALPDQRQVMVNGRRVGYCGSKPNMPLNLIMVLPPDYRDSVREFVEQQIGTVSKVCELPAMDEEGNAEPLDPVVVTEEGSAEPQDGG